MLGPPKPRRQGAPVAVSLDDLAALAGFTRPVLLG